METVRKGECVRHRHTGVFGTAAEDGHEDSVVVKQDDGAFAVWALGDTEPALNGRVVRDFLRIVFEDVDAGRSKRPSMNPKDYGFNTEDELWRALRRLAGLSEK